MSASLHRAIPFVLALLGLAGFGIGSYLTIAHWGHQPIACGGVGDCGYVNSSEYATVGGVPVSGLGALLYLAMTGTAIAWARYTGSRLAADRVLGSRLGRCRLRGLSHVRRAGRAARDLRLVRHVG